MTKQEMWEAVQNSDANYDGMFFYAVKTTGIFCRPSCKSKPPKRENVCFFETAEQAKSAGFRPCKRCRSDLLEYKPMHEIAADIKKKLDGTVTINNELSLGNMGLTSRRITDIFKQEYGMTPKEYADLRRLSEAKKMLVDTNEKIIDIAYAAGFPSLCAFNRFFKKQLGQTPSEYRRKRKMATDYSDVKVETKNLILKKAEFEDWKTIYHNLWRHKESAKYMLWQPTETDEDAKDRMKRTIAFEEKPENKYALFVYLKKTGEAIGFAGMRELGSGIYEETGIALGPEFVRKGYGRQILMALLEEAEKLGAKEFHACNRTGNVASRALQLSCGFVFDSLSEEKTDPRTGETYILENHIYRF